MALVGLFVLDSDAHHLYTRLLHRGWPLLALSGSAGLAALAAITSPALRSRPALGRALGVLAVAAILAGWGVAQYPYLLGAHLSIAAAAPNATMNALGILSVAAVVLVVPSPMMAALAHASWTTQRKPGLAVSGDGRTHRSSRRR